MNQTICYDYKFDEKDQILIDPKYLKEGLFIKKYDVKDMSEFSRMSSVRCNGYKKIKKNIMGKRDFKDEIKYYKENIKNISEPKYTFDGTCKICGIPVETAQKICDCMATIEKVEELEFELFGKI